MNSDTAVVQLLRVRATHYHYTHFEIDRAPGCLVDSTGHLLLHIYNHWHLVNSYTMQLLAQSSYRKYDCYNSAPLSYSYS